MVSEIGDRDDVSSCDLASDRQYGPTTRNHQTENTKEWQRAQRNLLELRNLVHAQGAVFGLAVFPVLVELGPDYPFQDVVDSVLEFASANDIPVHDLLPAFLGRKGPDLWVSPMDQHPNTEGHAIAAESLLPFARALLERSRGDGV